MLDGWSSAVLAMNIPGPVFSCPLKVEKCICQRSSRPGEECTASITFGSPPFRVPLLPSLRAHPVLEKAMRLDTCYHWAAMVNHPASTGQIDGHSQQ